MGADVGAVLTRRRVTVVGDATGNVEVSVLWKNLVAIGEVFAIPAGLFGSKPMELEEANTMGAGEQTGDGGGDAGFHYGVLKVGEPRFGS